MDQTPTEKSESNTPKYHAPKDKQCPYCGQCFTSSSLGRHLDLYVRENNPKPPDGVHDVDEIREMREGITRRHPRSSFGGRRESSTPVRKRAPKTTSMKKDGPPGKHKETRSMSVPKDGQYVVDSTLSRFPFANRYGWEQTGVINDIPNKALPTEEDQQGTPTAGRRPSMQRSVSRQTVHKAQLDSKQKLSDALDTARAAELALREILSSWRAAKQHIDNESMPFDFDPLALDFPALTLQCLQPPPTLYSSTQHPTSTSWSVQSPGAREFGALKSYFQEEFKAWRLVCATATTSTTEDLTYPLTAAPPKDVREAVRRAEKSADSLEQQVDEHLHSAYQVWDQLPTQRQHELWVLELARSVGRKHKESQQMKEAQHKMRQEVSNLKCQIDQLNRLQQPKEYKILPPTTFPVGQDILAYAYGQGVSGGRGVGFNIEDRHEDLTSLVTKSIERWKNVITATRTSASGMGAQKPLDQHVEHNDGGDLGQRSHPASQAHTPQLTHAATQPHKRPSTTSVNGTASERTGTSTTTGPLSVGEMSDEDADAEMEDEDSYAMGMSASGKPATPALPQNQEQQTLDVPRTRRPTRQHQHQQNQHQHQQQEQIQQHAQSQQRGAVADPRFLMQNGTDSTVARNAMPISRSMPNMNMAMQAAPMDGGDIDMAMQNVRGDGMYM